MDRTRSDSTWSLLDSVDWLSSALAARFAIDLRALAAFRIGLGLLLLADLGLRSRSLTAFYTDYGVLPRQALFTDYPAAHSVYALSGEPWVVSLLFVVAGVFALALLVGYHTRLVAVVSWLLLLSLHARNPMLLNGGDNLLRMLVFWSVFLPLGARWSVDAVRRADARTNREFDTDSTTKSDADATTEDGADAMTEAGAGAMTEAGAGATTEAGADATTLGPDGPSVASVATVAVLMQVLIMYLTNAIHKFEGDLWMSGEAVVYIMRADQLTYLLGNHITEFSGLLRGLTVMWVVLLFASPLLIALTGIPRAAIAAMFVGMHLGMAVTMRIGLFPIVVVVGFLPFFQTSVLDAVERVVALRGWSTPLSEWRTRFESLARSLPSASMLLSGRTVPEPPDGVSRVISASLDRGRIVFSTIIPGIFLVLILLSSAQAVDYTEVPDPAEDVLKTTNTGQSWRMFAPDPTHTTRWPVIPGTLEDGTQRDILRDSEVDFERPTHTESIFPTFRWRKYISNVYSVDNMNHRSYFANYLCEDWNRTHETGVKNISVHLRSERTNPYNGTIETENRIKGTEYDCSAEFIQNTSEG